MISHPDRRKAVRLITEAIHSGASKMKACKEIGISHKTYNRWILNGSVKADGRPDAVRPVPVNKLNHEERNVSWKHATSVILPVFHPRRLFQYWQITVSTLDQNQHFTESYENQDSNTIVGEHRHCIKKLLKAFVHQHLVRFGHGILPGFLVRLKVSFSICI